METDPSQAIIEKAYKDGLFYPLDDSPWEESIQDPEDRAFLHSMVSSDDDTLRRKIAAAREQCVFAIAVGNKDPLTDFNLNLQGLVRWLF